MKLPFHFVACAALAMVLGACAAGGGTKSVAPAAGAAKKAPPRVDTKAAPEVRAVARWQLIIDGHASVAYDFLSPGARSTKSREDWASEIAHRPVKWTKAEYLDKACDSDDACEIRLKVEFDAPLLGAPGDHVTAPGFLTERWVRIDGIWYLLPEALVSGGLH